MMAEDRCICCGEVIPEGRMVCPYCLTSQKKKTEPKLKPYTIGTKFSFPENTEIELDSGVHRVTQKMCTQIVDEYDNFLVQQIANTARENGIGELFVLNKKTIMDALSKQMPKKPVDLAKSELYGRCAVCGKAVHVGERYCDQCGQKLDWGEEDGK